MLLVRRGRERIHVGPGEEVRIPAKVRHTFEVEVDSTYTAEFRPALRVDEFFRVFALPTDKRGNPRIGDAARLMRAYSDEFLYFPFIPVSVQRALAVPLSKLGERRMPKKRLRAEQSAPVTGSACDSGLGWASVRECPPSLLGVKTYSERPAG
jgi:hypothetical protein